MVRPLIGITAGHMLGAAERQRRQDVSFGCGKSFVTEVLAAGGAATILPPVGERDAVRAAIGAVDALLLSGGGDPSALEFRSEPHPNIRFVDPARDRMEIEATRLAVRRGMPILGICRGIQILNVALGGGLIQDIPSEIERPVRHWALDPTPSLSHTIDVDPGSLLASLIGEGRIAVTSIHHQAVGRVAGGLRVTARSRDGVVEAVESADGRPFLGVQFHPEETAGDRARFGAIFEWFVTQAHRYRRSRRRAKRT